MILSRAYVRSPYRQGSKGWLNEGIFTLNNFGGGLNNVEADTVIADNQMCDTQNMKFVSQTLMEKRQGTVEYHPEIYHRLGHVELPEGNLYDAVIWTDKYEPLDGEPVFVQASSRSFYVGGAKICDLAGSTFKGVNYVGKYYFVDGKNIYVYNGTTYYKIISEPMGYLAQDIAINTKDFYVDEIPAQTKVGDSVYFLSSTIINYTGADITRTITAIDTEAKKITVDTNIITGASESIPHTKNGKDTPVYMYVPLDTNYIMGEEVWDDANHLCYYKPCVNELADDYSGGSYIPNAPTIIVTHSNRLFVSGDDKSPNAVFMSGYSAVAPQPLHFPSSASVSVKPNGQSIIDLVVFDNSLIIGRHEDMFCLYGDSEYPKSVVPNGTPFYVKQLDVSTGFMSADCGSMLNNFYIYLGYDGRFYKLNTPTTFVEYLMTRPIEYKCDIYKAPIGMSIYSTFNMSSVAYRNEVWFSLSNGYTIIYNYDNMAFTYYTGLNASSFYTDGNVLYIGRFDGKFAYFCDGEDIYTDLDQPIVAKQYTKRYDFGSSANFKYFKRFMITSQTYDEILSSIDVNAEVDYFYVFDATVSCETTIFNSNKSMFGISEWGDIFTNKDIIKSKYTNLDIKGRTIQFRFDNDKVHVLEDGAVVGEPFRVYDINLMYSNRDVR